MTQTRFWTGPPGALDGHPDEHAAMLTYARHMAARTRTRWTVRLFDHGAGPFWRAAPTETPLAPIRDVAPAPSFVTLEHRHVR